MKKIVQIILIIIIILSIILGFIYIIKNKENTNELNYNELKRNSVMYNENATLEELKEEYGMTGENNLYEVQTEYDGRKVLAIKEDENFKVAFTGLIKNDKPDINEVSYMFETNSPKENGIWIEQESREKIIDYLNNNLSSKYEINENGYLIISKKEASEIDDKIDKVINGDSQYIIGIRSENYYIDAKTGNIIKNPFEDLNKYQTYTYCENENKMIIFITENKSNKLSDDEIFESIIELLK